jgi:hypothetical protein
MCSDAADCCFEVGFFFFFLGNERFKRPPPPPPPPIIPSGYMMYTHWVSSEICVLLLKKEQLVLHCVSQGDGL